MASTEPRFARIAAMIGDPTRVRLLACPLDGTLHTQRRRALDELLARSNASN